MKISLLRATELLPIVKKAIAAQEECWNVQKDLEACVEKQFSNLDAAIQDLAVCGVESLTIQDVQDLFKGLLDERDWQVIHEEF